MICQLPNVLPLVLRAALTNDKFFVVSFLEVLPHPGLCHGSKAVGLCCGDGLDYEVNFSNARRKLALPGLEPVESHLRGMRTNHCATRTLNDTGKKPLIVGPVISRLTVEASD